MSWEETPWMTDNEVLAARKAYFDRKMAIMDARSAMMDAEEQGRKKGEGRAVQLFLKLHEAGRDDEFFRAGSDDSLLRKLLKEFHL